MSYLQAAHSLAQFRQLDSRAHRETDNPHQQFLDALAELETMQTKAAAVAPDELKRLAENHKETLKMAQASWESLAAKQKADRSVPVGEWNRTERAFDLCRKLTAPQSVLSDRP